MPPTLPDDTLPIGEILTTLDAAYPIHPMDEITQHDPYKVLVACILSLRTKDEVTIPASLRMFELATTPQAMVQVPVETLQQAVFPVGFYRTKAETILEISRDLLDRYDGQVPNTVEALLTLKGVGRKTANLVVGLGHQLPSICVDTHVHRISNRLGYLVTQTPEETEMALREKLPQRYWHLINKVMVLHGQQVCKPIGPRCDVCPVAHWCHKINVKPRAVKKAAKG
jgi:endonuclease-3